MSQRAVASVVLLLLGLATSATAQLLPQPPRHGKNTVQMIVGGTDKIPMCIVPPRAYVDGTPIPPGTPCEIKVYRSRQDGRPGSYTELVGSATGKVTKPDDLQAWIDVAAKAGPEPGKQAVYLASSATIGGQESDLNNQWTTIVWAPGNFSVKEYPAAGSKPGPPPGRKAAAPPGQMDYPAWLREGAEAGGWRMMTPSMDNWDSAETPTLNLPLDFKIAADGTVTGQLDEAIMIGWVRSSLGMADADITLPKNKLGGRLDANTFKAQHAFQMVVKAKVDGRLQEVRVAGDTTFEGVRSGASIVGQANTKGVLAMGGDRDTVEKAWRFEAVQTGGAEVRLQGQPFESPLGRPGPAFATPASATGGNFSQQLLDSLTGTVALSVGDSYYFSSQGSPKRYYLDGQWLPVGSAPQRQTGREAQCFAGPASVLREERVGDGVRVRAVGKGTGEVWIRTYWTSTDAQGQTRPGFLTETWLVLVGTEAVEGYRKSQIAGTPPTVGGTNGPIRSGVVRGKVVDVTGAPVAGAAITLRHTATNGSYSGASWTSGADGSFTLDLAAADGGFGLVEGRYQVMPFKRSVDTSADDNRNDLWPKTEAIIELTTATAARGVTVPEPLVMVRVGELFGN